MDKNFMLEKVIFVVMEIAGWKKKLLCTRIVLNWMLSDKIKNFLLKIFALQAFNLLNLFSMFALKNQFRHQGTKKFSGYF